MAVPRDPTYRAAMVKAAAAALAALLALTLSACGDSKPPLAKAVDSCKTEINKDLTTKGTAAKAIAYMDLATDGKSISIDGPAAADKYDTLEEEAALICLLGETKAPSGVSARMDNTTALDGAQHETWGTLTVTWTYHPDNGLDVIFEDKS